MKWGIRKFVRLPRSPRRIRADVEDELRFEIDMRTADLMRQGLDANQARGRAIADFGDLSATLRYCEELDMETESANRRCDILSDLRADITIAWRAMRRTPVFAVAVVATLALGIGANTAIFSVVRRVLIQPLPYGDAQSLYRLYTVPSRPDGDDDKLSAVELDALAHQSRSIAGVAIFGNYSGLTYSDERTTEPWQTASVSVNFFDVLGIRPLLGRPFAETDLAPGGPGAVIIGYALWQRLFNGDEAIVGRHIKLNDIDFTVVGVLPANFVGPTFSADAVLPLNMPGVLRSPGISHQRVWRAVARLRSGIAPDRARSELALLRPRVAAQYSDIKNAGVVRLVQLHAAIVGGAAEVLIVVMAAVLLVLVITCVNIASLFLARATARRRELGVRAALGAGPGRLLRQVLTESVLYGLAGGAAGAALAFVMKNALLSLAGSALPRLGDVRIDSTVLAIAAIVSIVCGLAFGFIPAIAATRVDVRDALADSADRGASGGRERTRARATLLAAQIAFAITLLIGAGLLMRTFVRLVGTDLGYSADENTLTFRVNLQAKQYAGADARRDFFQTLISRLHALPGALAVGYTEISPWNGPYAVPVRVLGRPADDNNVVSVTYQTASDEYFAALGTPLRAGRAFNASDRVGSPRVVVISESVARRFWSNENPIGARVTLGTGGPDSAQVREVIGVVGDVRPDVTSDIAPTVYAAAGQVLECCGEFMLRTRGDAAALTTAVKQTLRSVDAHLPLINPRTLRDVLKDSIARQQIALALLGAFAALSLVIAVLGVYSVMAYAVMGRTREFGIRQALGASGRSILLLVVRQGLAVILVGVAAGLLLSALSSRFVAALLVGVSAHDGLTFVLAPAVVVIAATAACLIPARAATRVHPADALRVE